MISIPRSRALAAFVAALAAIPALAQAQEREVPYWASIRADEVNMRVGPAETYTIMWVYHRKHLPMKVIRLKEGWRLVQDPDGATGWMLARFLKPERTGIVTHGANVEMREKGEAGARLKWWLEPGVVGILGDCENGWCQFDVAGHSGFVRQERLWGTGEP